MADRFATSMEKIDDIVSRNAHTLGGWELQAYRRFLAALPERIQEVMGVEDGNKKLVLSDFHYSVPEDLIDPERVTRIREQGGDLSIPLRASFSLVKDGKVVSKTRPRLVSRVPFPTDMGTFVLGGQEFNVSKQLRLSPGVYVTKRKDRRVKAQVNSSTRQNMDVYFNPDKHKFTFRIGGRSLPLHPVLSALGVPEEEMQKAWGHTLYARNKKSGKAAQDAVTKLYNIMYRFDDPGTPLQNIRKIQQAFKETELDPWVTKATLGKEYPHASGDMLLRATKKALGVSAGEVEEDDMEALHFKVPFDIGNMVNYALERNGNRIRNKVKARLRRTDDLDTIISRPLVTLSTTIKRKYNEDELARTPDQHNPLGMYHDNTEITFLGEGGISDRQMITDKARGIHDSMIGFVDPVHTPEGSNVGMNIHLSDRATFEPDGIRQPVLDRMGREQNVGPRDIYDKYVALPGEVKVDKRGKPKLSPSGKVDALHKGKIVQVPASKVNFVMHGNPNDAFSGSGQIPFVNADMGVRAGVGVKQMGQALPLKNREAPLVRPLSSSGETTGGTFYRRMNVTAPESMPDGTVTRVSATHIYVTDDTGKKHKIPMKKHYQLNGDATINDEPIVKAGDRVTGGQVLAENQYSRDGETALGANLDVAFVPFYGLNHQDGLVVSQSAANKLTSLHSYEHEASRDSRDVFSKKKFLAHYPTLYEKRALEKLDDEGVVLPGQVLEPGDPILLKMTPQKITEDDILMGNINKAFKKPLRRDEKTWAGDHPAVVRKVVKTKKGIRVYLDTEEPAQVGDKITGKHGQKGVITAIMDDKEMPKYDDGTVPDVLQNPAAVPSRMNAGQIHESMAARIAQARGEPYLVHNMLDQVDSEALAKEMVDAGVAQLDDKGNVDIRRTLTLPNGKKVKVFAGPQYISKLKQQAASYYSARGRKDDYDIVSRRPTSGPKMGPLGWYGMLAHGATENLKEISGWKSEKNDDIWRAYETGQALPAPKTTFALDRMIGILNAAGINVAEAGDDYQLMPLTDQDVDEMSSGEVPNPAESVRIGKSGPNETLESQKGGLYDQKLFGGMQGEKYGHITLASKMPNPVFETPIKKILGLTGAEYDDLVSGDKGVLNGKVTEIDADNRKHVKTRGAAFEDLLGSVNVDEQLEELKGRYKRSRGQTRNNIAAKIRYLSGLQRTGKKPTDLLISKLPVIPPKFRPVYLRDDGSLGVSDLTVLYQRVGLFNQALKDTEGLPSSVVNRNYLQLYNAARELQTTGRTEGKRQTLGALAFMKGGRPKSGHFMGKIMAKREAIGGRATIMPDPKLDIDEIRIPDEMAWKIFEPKLMRRMVQTGVSAPDAAGMVEERTNMASNMLNAVMEDNPVIIRRDPKLHKFNMLAFRAKRTPGKAIYIPPLVTKGFNADFDGDQQIGMVIVGLPTGCEDAIMQTLGKEVLEKGCIMASRLRENIPALSDGNVYIFNLEDFPHGALIDSTQGENGRIDWYYAIPGTKVLSYAEATGEVKWAEVSGWSVHHKRVVEIVTLQSGRQIITDNDPRAVYGIRSGTFDFIRSRPRDAIGMFVPTNHRLNITPTDAVVEEISTDHITSGYSKLKKRLELDLDFGYYLGVMAGDGWCSTNKGKSKAICIASANDLIMERFEQCVYALFDGKRPNRSITISRESYGDSRKITYSSTALCDLTIPLIGRGAAHKHLPAFFMSASEEFRLGLFAGLMDTDGSISTSNAKSKSQLMANFYSTSLRLVQEVQLLSSSLGIKGRITQCRTPAQKQGWILSFSNIDIQRWAGYGMVHSGKLKKLRSVPRIDPKSAVLARFDIVPISRNLAGYLRGLIGASRYAAPAVKSLYSMLYQSIAKGSISRIGANKVIAYLGRDVILQHQDGELWLNLVDNTDVSWDLVKSYEKTDQRETGYDLTVPGYETFMNVDGVILSNTMSVTVPIGPKAVQEAWDKLLPSKNLLKPGQDRPIIQPTEESIAGLYAGTRKKRETGLKFDKAADVMKAMDAGEIQPTDGITLGDTKTTAGHVLAMQKVPKAFRDYSSVLSSKNVEQILARIAKEQPKAYSKAVRGLKDAGDIMATEMGLSFQASDFTPIRDKSEIARLKPGQELTQTQKNRIARRLRQHLGEDSVLAIMADSGAKGSWNNIQQMLYSPISVKDATGQTVPHLIRRGFAEGLSFKDYWSAAKGARKGLIDKGVQTAHPGYFGKEILRSSLGGVIQQGDADDPEGVDYPVEHPTVMNRYLAADVVDGNGEVIAKAGDPVTSELVQAAKRLRIKKLSVRSPLTTKANDGFYAKDFGRMPGDRKLRPGSDVGIVAGQTLTEPATQLTLKKFHAGGSGDAASVAGLDQAWDILKGKAPEGTRAPLSPRKAKVASIETLPSGASVITLSTGEKINAAPGRSLTVKQGDTVEKGQQLQEGNPDPQDVLRYRGFRPMQMYMVDQIEKAYGKYAPDRRYIETVVGGLTRYARVRDPGDSDYAPGEIVPINKLKSYNKQATGGLPVAYEPHFLGIGPSGVKAKQDWASAMLHGDLARRVPDLAAAGATSPVHSTDPTMPYLHSAEFGDELEEGRY